ncbi:hypothetical protein Bcop_0507 [Bacteroides coprosuis DSM 18011]|uniref:Uncharacterized protein n=1 Tax=Bacteroides coprosuis DSM 18011 TaxID=679937 RepID=F3ZRK0_9BACE|nr:hypothetical protein Bcop_0507 [Bacteroides coprosuis DSM 18011]
MGLYSINILEKKQKVLRITKLCLILQIEIKTLFYKFIVKLNNRK